MNEYRVAMILYGFGCAGSDTSFILDNISRCELRSLVSTTCKCDL
jgi:hypothetical protein